MKKIFSSICVVSIVALCNPGHFAAAGSTQHGHYAVQTQQVAAPAMSIIRLAPGVDVAAFCQQYGLTLVGSIPALSLHRVLLVDSNAIAQWSGDARVVHAQLDDEQLIIEARQRYYGSASSDFDALQRFFGGNSGGGDDDPEGDAIVVSPNQPFDESWRNWGLAETQVTAAQQHATGAGVIVAVVDTGIDLEHPVLAARLLPGYDFVENDNQPDDAPNGVDEDEDGLLDEATGHGTHIAGIIGNVASQAKILPVRVLNSDGGGTLFDIVQGIVYAADNGAKVINLSLSTSEHSPVLESAINYALSRKIVIVAAASGSAGGLQPPASYPGVISVGASTKGGAPADFSNDYAGLVNVLAPGEYIYSAYYDGNNAWWTGTSMATAFVSGEAALLIERGGCVPDCIRDAIVSQVDFTSGSGGRINVDKAIKNVKLDCFLIADDDAIGTGISSIKNMASRHGKSSDFLVNEDRKRKGANQPLRWNELYAGDIVNLPAGQGGDEGWFALPTTIRYADNRRTNLSYPDWIAAFFDGSLPEEQLDKVRDVKPLKNADLAQLVGRTCVAVVQSGDISMNYGPTNANLQGDRYGNFTFKVLAVLPKGSVPESESSSSLTVLRVRVETPLQPARRK
jgi:hypothetical protein